MSWRALCTKQESWATMLGCRKNLLSSFRIVFCFIRILHLVSCRHFSQAEVLVTTCSRTVSRLLKILVRFLLKRSTMGKKNRFWPNHPYVRPPLHVSGYEVCYWLLFKGQMNQKIDIFSFVALPSPNTKKDHPHEIWVKIFLPKPL